MGQKEFYFFLKTVDRMFWVSQQKNRESLIILAKENWAQKEAMKKAS